MDSGDASTNEDDDGDEIIVRNTFLEIKQKSPFRQKAQSFSFHPKGSLTMSPLGLSNQSRYNDLLGCPAEQGSQSMKGSGGATASSATKGAEDDEAQFDLLEAEPWTPRACTQAVPEDVTTPVSTKKDAQRWMADTPELGTPCGLEHSQIDVAQVPQWPSSFEQSGPALQQAAPAQPTYHEAWQQRAQLPWNQGTVQFPLQLPQGPTPQRLSQDMHFAQSGSATQQQLMQQQFMQQAQLQRAQQAPQLQVQGLLGSPVEHMPLSQFGLGGGYYFKFTLRRADDVELGLQVARARGDRVLEVLSVLPGCAIEAWNKQCEARAAWKAVFCGDQIVKVNNALGCTDMLEECRSKQLLEIVVVRENRG